MAIRHLWVSSMLLYTILSSISGTLKNKILTKDVEINAEGS